MISRRQLLSNAFLLPVVLSAPKFAWAERNSAALIGLVGPMTGPNALNGQLMKEGAQAAADYINDMGGIGGRPMRLIFEDDAGDPKQSIVAANSLISRGANIDFVIGHATSATTLPAASVYAENEIILLSPVNADVLTAKPSPFVFRIIPPNRNYAPHVAEQIIESGKLNIAIVHNQTDYGKGFADLLQQDLNELGIREGLFESTSVGQRDFQTLISKFKHYKINTIALAVYPCEAALIIRQAADQGLISLGVDHDAPFLIGHSLLVSHEFYAAAGEAAFGMRVVSIKDSDQMSLMQDLQRDEQLKKITSYFYKRGISQINVTHAIIFSAVQIASQALATTARSDSASLSETIHREKFSTIRGPLSFAPNGELQHPDRSLALYEIGPEGARFIKNYG